MLWVVWRSTFLGGGFDGGFVGLVGGFAGTLVGSSIWDGLLFCLSSVGSSRFFCFWAPGSEFRGVAGSRSRVGFEDA